jgi:pimeloyl-ACP methyl ester carboxylesterase
LTTHATPDDAGLTPDEATGNSPTLDDPAATLVLLHGTTGDGRTHFGHLADRFTDRYTVVLPDYAGSGRSVVPEGPLTLDLLVNEIADVIRDGASPPVDLVGFSLGAVVAAAATAAHPDLVRRLILVAGWAAGDDPRHQLVFDTWAELEGLDPGLSARLGALLAFTPAFLNGLGHEGVAELLPAKLPDATRRQLELILTVDVRDRLGHIAAPTLVIGCTRDALVPVDHARALHEAIAGSRYAEIDCGHAVIYEKPDELVALVRDFLLPVRGKGEG